MDIHGRGIKRRTVRFLPDVTANQRHQKFLGSPICAHRVAGEGPPGRRAPGEGPRRCPAHPQGRRESSPRASPRTPHPPVSFQEPKTRIICRTHLQYLSSEYCCPEGGTKNIWNHLPFPRSDLMLIVVMLPLVTFPARKTAKQQCTRRPHP